MQSGLAEHAGRQVGEIRRIAGAIPKIILGLSPQFARQEAALVAVELIEITQVIPLRNDQVRFERASELHEHFVERFFVGNLRKPQHLAPQRR